MGNKKRFEPEKSVVFWFLRLEDARRNNRFGEAAECQRQLVRLGVYVSYAGEGK
jgi:hypothetical protein